MATTPMATDLDAATNLENEFRRQQSFVVKRLRSSAFARTTWILGFVGVVIITLTLLKIPHIDGVGLPLLLKHELLISFTVFSSLGIFLNLSVFFNHLLLCINERIVNKNQSLPSQDLMKKCIRRQQNIITAIKAAEAFSIVFGSLFWVYVFVIAVFGTFIPHQDPNGVTGVSANLLQTATYFWWLVKIPIDGFPQGWGFD